MSAAHNNAMDMSEGRWHQLHNDQQERLCERLGLIRVSSFSRRMCCWHELPEHFRTTIRAHFEAYP